MIFEVTFRKLYFVDFLVIPLSSTQRYICTCLIVWFLFASCYLAALQLDRSISSMSWFLSLLLFDKVLQHFNRWHTLVSIRGDLFLTFGGVFIKLN